MSLQESYRGIVSGILSGDSMVIRFVDPQIDPIQNVCLEHVIAPRFGKPDGKTKDEPHAFDSWNFLRNLCIGQPVLVAPPNNKTDLTRNHPAFGRMPVTFTRVALCSRNNQDVGLLCVEAGFVHIRAPRIRDNYVNSLFAGEARAKNSHFGIWRPNGFIRPLPVHFDSQDLLAVGEFDAVVETVINGTTVALFLMPNHERIIFQIAACRSPSAKRDNSAEYGSEARQFTIRQFLHRTARIRLCSVNHDGLFMGPVLDRSDRAIRSLLSEGLARFNSNTADISPSSIEYKRCECEAKAQRKNIWAEEPEYRSDLQSFDGEVRKILGSAAIIVDGQIVQFSCIKSPPFVPGGGSESLGFEVHDRLRKLLIGNFVHVEVDGAIEGRIYGTVFLNDVCVNELLCKDGLAKVVLPICGNSSDNFQQMKKLESEAKSRFFGLYSKTLVPPLVVRDFSLNSQKDIAYQHLNEFKGRQIDGIVEDILGGNRFLILAPTAKIMVRVAVNGLLPLSPNDRLGCEAISFCASRFLNRDVRFEIVDTDRSGGFIANIKTTGANPVDVSEVLLSEGLAEIHKRTALTLSNYDCLLATQEKAIKECVGKWAEKSRLDVELQYNEFYPVRIVAIWDVTELVVQFLSDSMREIDDTLRNFPNQKMKKTLMKNDIVCVLFNNAKYRAKIEKPDDDHQIVRVKLIDFDLFVDINKEFVFELPKSLEGISPQALTVNLAFLNLEKAVNEEKDRIFNEFNESVFYMHLMYFTDFPDVMLFDAPNVNAANLNSVILDECCVKYSYTEYDMGPEYNDMLNILHDIHVERYGEEEEEFYE